MFAEIQLTFNGLHGVMSQKIEPFRETIVGGICTTCDQRVQRSIGAMCYHNPTQHHYDIIRDTEQPSKCNISLTNFIFKLSLHVSILRSEDCIRTPLKLCIFKRSYTRTLRRKHREETISAPRRVLKIESSNFLLGGVEMSRVIHSEQAPNLFL
jgi:hypothetical protein